MFSVLSSRLPVAYWAHVIDGPGSTAISDLHTDTAAENGCWEKESEISENRGWRSAEDDAGCTLEVLPDVQ